MSKKYLTALYFDDEDTRYCSLELSDEDLKNLNESILDSTKYSLLKSFSDIPAEDCDFNDWDEYTKTLKKFYTDFDKDKQDMDKDRPEWKPKITEDNVMFIISDDKFKMSRYEDLNLDLFKDE